MGRIVFAVTITPHHSKKNKEEVKKNKEEE
jgi:hypothetical protein